ncbi:hypothetical protein CRG98_048142 [Punica granatum]|uniref:histidine kinase n=1 Tax=Punica granatum TaxID=22663 RepID=A0A2I0HIE0_PUNGR|nr:hypothetical protein CRG98_048142 [Punica granatum]
MLQDQFGYHVNNSFSFVIFLTQVFRMHPVLDDDQCREVFYNYVLGPFSMFPFLGGVTFPCRSLPNVPHEYIAETDIMNAIATSDTVISRPFHFKQCHHRLHFALIVPLDSVYRIFNSTREEHISAGSGYIATFFKFDCLVKHVLGQLDGNQTISVAVHDVTNSTEYFLLFDSGDYKSNQFHVYESRLELGDPFRKYKITCWYHQKASLSWIVISITCLTIVIGLLLGCILLGAAIHSLRIQELKAQVEAVNAASSSVLRAASGEIKMPANSILETLVLVLSTELRSPQKDYVRVAQEGCKRLIDLIDEVSIMVWTRLGARIVLNGAMGYIALVFDFDSLVEHVLGQLDGNQTISVAVHDVTNSTEYFLLFDSGDYKSNKFHVYESRLELGDPFRKYNITCWYHQKAPLSWIFLAVASGEIKMPVNSILGMIELLPCRRHLNEFETLVVVLSTELRSPQKDYVRVAQEGCKRLIDLIDEVADNKNPDIPI